MASLLRKYFLPDESLPPVNVAESLNLIVCGIDEADDRKSLYPIDQHTKQQLFDLGRMRKYSFDEEHMRYQKSSYRLQSVGESFEELVQNYSRAITAEVGLDVPCGALVASTITADFSSSQRQTAENSSSAKYAQKKMVLALANLTLPVKKEGRSGIRRLLSDEARKDIGGINSLNQAREVINTYGPLYIHRAVFGGSLTCSAIEIEDTQKITTSEELAASIASEIDHLLKAKGGVSISEGENRGSVNKSLIFEATALGGTQSLILCGKEEQWEESLNQDIALVNVELAPISNLAEENSEAEIYLRLVLAEKCNEAVIHQKRIGGFPGPGSYRLRSEVNGHFLALTVVRDSESKRDEHSTWVSCPDCEIEFENDCYWCFEKAPDSDGASASALYYISVCRANHPSGWYLCARRGVVSLSIWKKLKRAIVSHRKLIDGRRDDLSTWAHCEEIKDFSPIDSFAPQRWQVIHGLRPNTIQMFVAGRPEGCSREETEGAGLVAAKEGSRGQSIYAFCELGGATDWAFQEIGM